MFAKKSILLVLLFMPFFLLAEDRIKATVKEATVYLSNASITANATHVLKPGINKVIIEDLPNYLLDNSVQVELSNGVGLISIITRYNVLKDNRPSSEIALKIEELEDQIRLLEEGKKVLQGEEDVILKNTQIGNEETGWDSSQLETLISFYRKRMTEIFKRKFEIDKEVKQLRKKIQPLYDSPLPGSGDNRKEIVLELDSKTPRTTTITIKYVVDRAGWTPSYEIRAKSVDEDLQLVYKAKIYQNTGQDWKNAQLRVSTYKPKFNQNRPILSPLYANIFKPTYALKRKSIPREKALAGQAAPMVLNDESDAVFNAMQFRERETKKYEPITQSKEEQLNIVYEVKGRHDIMSGEEARTLQVASEKIEAKYKYHTVPKLQKDVYLLASIKDWQKLNLISGEGLIYLNNQFVGKMDINTNFTNDEFLISLGVDNRVVVKRKKIDDFSKVKKLKSKIAESFQYEILVKNNSGKTINIEILDQLPISQDSRIIVEPQNLGDADYDEKTASLLWKKKLGAEKNTLKFSYIISYPKGEKISYQFR